jgi:hypothetical protein
MEDMLQCRVALSQTGRISTQTYGIDIKSGLALYRRELGSKPGSPGKVNVSLVFQHVTEGRIYVAGYSPERASNRVFALDLIMVINERN